MRGASQAPLKDWEANSKLMPCRQRVTNTVQTSKHTRVEFKHSLHIKKKKIKYQNQFIQVIIKLSILQPNFEFKKGIKYENRVHFLTVKNVSSPPPHTHTKKTHTKTPINFRSNWAVFLYYWWWQRNGSSNLRSVILGRVLSAKALQSTKDTPMTCSVVCFRKHDADVDGTPEAVL